MPKVLTLLDIQRRNGTAADIGIIEEIGLNAPEVTQLPAKVISGISYPTYIRKGVPRVGFRKPNAPADFVVSEYERRNIELFPMSAMIPVDDLILSGSENPSEVLADEATGFVQGATLSAGNQMFYGLELDKNGFPGLMNFVDDSMVMSASQDAAVQKTEKGTSVWAIIEGPRAVSWVYGNGRGMSIGPFVDGFFTGTREDGTTGEVPGKIAKFNAWLAIVSHSKLAVARMKNISDVLTDDMLADLISKFPAGMKPTKLIMNRKAINLLRKSRAVQGISGSVDGGSFTSAPMPTNAFGVSIIETDSILDDESNLKSIKGISHYGKFAGK